MEGLLQYGAIGTVLAVFLALFVWAFKLMVTNLISHLGKVEAFMGEAVATMKEIKEAIESLHRDESNRITRLPTNARPR